jgi:hypothetical protein
VDNWPTKKALLLKTRIGWEHPLVKNADDTHPARPDTIENHMFVLFVPSQPFADRVTGAPNFHTLREHLETTLKAPNIDLSLIRSHLSVLYRAIPLRSERADFEMT